MSSSTRVSPLQEPTVYPAIPSVPDRANFSHQLLFVTIFLLVYCALWISYRLSESRKLAHIPSVGPTTPLLSFFGTFKYYTDSRKAIASGISKWPNRPFRIPDLFKWVVVITDPNAIDEIRRAPEHTLSASEATDQDLQTEFTMGKHLSENPYHTPVIRGPLTKALPLLVPELRDELVQAFEETIPVTEEWSSVKVLESIRNILCRSSNRIIVGPPLCRNKDFINLNVEWATSIIITSVILRMVPRFLRPLVNSWISKVPERMDQAMKHLSPLLAARRREREEGCSTPQDILTWLMDNAQGEERTDWYLTSRVLMVNFAAIHTSSMTFTHAFYYLASYPEYLRPLREEVEEAVRQYGWTKEAVDRMEKVDSFIKEAQRLNPLSNLMLVRVASKDFTFSDGTLIPAGTSLAVSADYSHRDPARFDDPLSFDGFRFYRLKNSQSPSGSHENAQKKLEKYDLVSTSGSEALLAFGNARHVCPGRFLAACMIKLMFAHLVLTYDVKLPDDGFPTQDGKTGSPADLEWTLVHELEEGEEKGSKGPRRLREVQRPRDMWIASACIPNPKARVLFRKRQ